MLKLMLHSVLSPSKGFIFSWIVAFAVFGTPHAHAVSLGQAIVKSKMGQPFEAIIPIIARADEAGGLVVNLAPSSEYEKLKVNYSYFLRKIEGEMVFDEKLKPKHYRLFSRTPLFEPEIRVIVDAVWPEGRFLRSYVLLVQPSENLYDIAKTLSIGNEAAGNMMNRLPGEVEIIREGEPGANAMPLNDQYWGNPPPVSKREISRRPKAVAKAKVPSKDTPSLSTEMMGVKPNNDAIEAKKKELEALQQHIKSIENKVKP